MQARIRDILQLAADKSDFSGVCLVKRDDEIIYHQAFGLAHRGFEVANRISTRFDTASITKLFTAIAIMQLVEQGLFGLDTAVMPFLERDDTKISNAVTVFHLLTHTSGIADDADEEAGEDYELLFVDKPNYSIRTTEAFLPQFAYKDPVFPPGNGVRYNNCAFVLLGLMIEKATGQAYRDYVRDHVFQRAGMTGADFCAMDGVHPDLAEGYKKGVAGDGGTTWTKNIYSYPPIGSPDGGATVTAIDLDTFVRAIKADVLVNAASRQALFRPYVLARNHGDRKLMNGFGFEFTLTPEDRIIAIHKDGGNAGVAGILAYFPDSDTTSILLANQDCRVWPIHREIEAVVLRA
ncbi:MAG TPA: serine hydrolase domain-containing protein [Thermomicrobiales bacterium]|nr:serine hydrolase domain-containing protein [Thermomicrobiales bacterium]